MAFRRRESAPPETPPADLFGGRALVFAFALRTKSYRALWGRARSAPVRRIKAASDLTLWRLARPSRCAESRGLHYLPRPPDTRRRLGSRPFFLDPPARRVRAHLRLGDPSRDASLSLSDLPGEKHLVLTPGLYPVLYIFHAGTRLQLHLVGAAPQLFGSVAVELHVPLHAGVQRTLEDVLALLAEEATDRTVGLSCDRRRIPALLRALDLERAGYSHRAIAIDLFGEARVKSDWRADSWLKSKTARLVRDARRFRRAPSSLIRRSD